MTILTASGSLTSKIEIDAGLVERCIMDLACFGAWGETGVWRPVQTPEWVAARDQYITWCRAAGLDVHMDAVGNVWGKLAGRAGGKSIVSGSHIDSQKPGGRYDGARLTPGRSRLAYLDRPSLG